MRANTTDTTRAGRPCAGLRARCRAQGGFTLIEMLVAMSILLVGIIATLAVFTASKSATLVAQRHEVGVHQAQREIERLRSLKYAELGLKTMASPSTSTDPRSPNFRVQSGNFFRVREGSPPLDEELVLLGSAPQGAVEPGPEQFVVGEGSSAITGKIYRYITWRNENCPAGVCDGTRNTKRLIIAIKIDPKRNLGPMNPIWATSIAIDPSEGPLGTVQQEPAPTGSSAQNFFLYDQRCGADDTTNSYTAPSAAHSTHDTGSAQSRCDNVTVSKRPDLMGPAAPSYTGPLPPFNFSNDLTGEYPAGLAMIRRETSCPASFYADSDAAGKWSVHSWATRKFTEEFRLGGRAFMSLWTTSVGSLAGLGQICVTLLDRLVSGSTVDVVPLGHYVYSYSPWPTTKIEPGKSCGSPDFPCGRQRSFGFTLTGTRVRAGARLVLAISVMSASEKDVVLLYDDPRYRSFLEVETTTPCKADGTPCRNS